MEKEIAKPSAPQDKGQVPSPTAEDRGRRQLVRGKVVSDKMNKTRVIEIVHTKQHNLYHKGLIRKTRLFIHDEKNESKAGDSVIAASTRPLSRNKNFRLVKILGKGATQ